MTENSKNNEKAKKTKTKEKDEDSPKKTKIKKTKADVRLFAFTGDAPLAEQGLTANRQKGRRRIYVFVFLHFPK